MVSAHYASPTFTFLTGRLMLAAVMMLATTISACSTKTPDDHRPAPVLSAPPNTTYPMPPLKANPEMGWVTNDGQRAKLADYQGKVLVLDFYATWCAPCRESIPRLNALNQQYGPKGLQIVGLNVGGPDDRIKVAAFAKELQIQYPLGFPDKSLTDLFLSGDQEIPQTFVFGPGGQLKARFIGYEESTADDVEKMVKEMVETEERK